MSVHEAIERGAWGDNKRKAEIGRIELRSGEARRGLSVIITYRRNAYAAEDVVRQNAQNIEVAGGYII